MNFELSEEHKIFQNTAAQFAQKEIAPLGAEHDEKEEFPKWIFKKAGDLGFLGIPYPEQYGGTGPDTIALCILTEEASKADAGIASGLIVQNTVGTSPVYNFGSEEIKQKYLVPAIKGDCIGCFCLTEPNVGSDVSSIEMTAKEDGDDYILNGSKLFVSSGMMADYTVVAARTEKGKGHQGITMFLVETQSPGLSRKGLKKLGIRAQDIAEFAFDDCRVPKKHLLGEKGKGFYQLMATVQKTRIVVGSACVGLAKAAFDTALRYAKERHQFGQPIGKFQGLQFKLADMAMEIELASVFTYKAAWMNDQGEKCIKEASMAKLYASQMVNRVAYDALQIHGGYGYMREYPLERYYRDARIMEIFEGTSEIQKVIIARELGL
ncbi:MAG: acyl-CoA dehydrogenase family protein [Thermodesulfobacteriota bacterium]|nr:acyl-CoA dehydrogenase family protein [Thermodesulfobacteriota bacterium]